MSNWKRKFTVPSYKGSNGIRYPSFWGSWLTWRAQLTGETAFWEKIIPYIPEYGSRDPHDYWEWTPFDIIKAFKQIVAERTGIPQDKDLVCPQCHGAGRIHIDEDEKGWDIWCLCTLVEKMFEWHEDCFSNSAKNIKPAAFTDMRTDWCESEKYVADIEEALNVSRSFATEPKTWLILTGTKGTGKTHLMNSIYGKFGPGVCLYLRAADFSRTVFKKMNEGDDALDVWLDKIRCAPLLLIDDLGTGNVITTRMAANSEGTRMGFVMSLMQDIIDFRWSDRTEYPTVVTTNETQYDLQTNWGILGDRLSDQINWIISLDMPSYRQTQQRAKELYK